MLLRAIVTGSTMSPPLLESMVVFGKARSLDRVRRFLEHKRSSPMRRSNLSIAMQIEQHYESDSIWMQRAGGKAMFHPSMSTRMRILPDQ